MSQWMDVSTSKSMSQWINVSTSKSMSQGDHAPQRCVHGELCPGKRISCACLNLCHSGMLSRRSLGVHHALNNSLILTNPPGKSHALGGMGTWWAHAFPECPCLTHSSKMRLRAFAGLMQCTCERVRCKEQQVQTQARMHHAFSMCRVKCCIKIRILAN